MISQYYSNILLSNAELTFTVTISRLTGGISYTLPVISDPNHWLNTASKLKISLLKSYGYMDAIQGKSSNAAGFRKIYINVNGLESNFSTTQSSSLGVIHQQNERGSDEPIYYVQPQVYTGIIPNGPQISFRTSLSENGNTFYVPFDLRLYFSICEVS